MNAENNIGFNKLFVEFLNEVSSSENSDMFLKEEGFDPDALVKEGLRKIKQIQMNIAAENTEKQYTSMKSNVLQKAKAEVERILSDTTFSLETFIKVQNINVSFRNFEKMTQEEIREFLERHYMLKLEKESKDKHAD